MNGWIAAGSGRWDLCASPYTTDSNNRTQLKSKDVIKREFGFSPDLGDAAALTFANPVKPKLKPIPPDVGEWGWT